MSTKQSCRTCRYISNTTKKQLNTNHTYPCVAPLPDPEELYPQGLLESYFFQNMRNVMEGKQTIYTTIDRGNTCKRYLKKESDAPKSEQTA